MADKENYEYKVFSMLDNMEAGTFFTVDKITKAENRDRFVEVVKAYIDLRIDPTITGWYIEFSNDYKQVHKKSW